MKFQKCRCSFNPFVRCNKLCTSSNAIDYSADVAMLLFYRKIKDNISDEGFFKRTLCRLLLPFAKAKYKKAARLRPDLSQKIDSLMDEQALCEAEKKPSLDKCCHPSAASLGEIIIRYRKRGAAADIIPHGLLCRKMGLSCRCP